MRYQLRIQDPLDPPQDVFLDALTELVTERHAVTLRAFFGFLTGSGVHAILGVAKLRDLLENGEVEFIVGLDAVTDCAGLKALVALSESNDKFIVRVVKNETGALIHPKMALLTFDDSSGASVVGSNNMSLGGLSGNVEGYSVCQFGPEDDVDLGAWDSFKERWDAALSEIDDAAMERAERNEGRLDRLRVAAAAEPDGDATVVVSDGQTLEAANEIDPDLLEPLLIAQIPGAGGRWSQVHFSIDISRSFFNAEPEDHPMLYLRSVDGSETEERPVVFAESNRNVKVEIGKAREAARELGYPDNGRPIVVMRRESSTERRFRYVLLMPGDPGHEAMRDLSDELFEGRGNQLPRVEVPRNRVLAEWPECPV